jgi:hypothetical protein
VCGHACVGSEICRDDHDPWAVGNGNRSGICGAYRESGCGRHGGNAYRLGRHGGGTSVYRRRGESVGHLQGETDGGRSGFLGMASGFGYVFVCACCELCSATWFGRGTCRPWMVEEAQCPIETVRSPLRTCLPVARPPLECPRLWELLALYSVRVLAHAACSQALPGGQQLDLVERATWAAELCALGARGMRIAPR